eukprot:751317-Hanusia_phi.AAC.6
MQVLVSYHVYCSTHTSECVPGPGRPGPEGQTHHDFNESTKRHSASLGGLLLSCVVQPIWFEWFDRNPLFTLNLRLCTQSPRQTPSHSHQKCIPPVKASVRRSAALTCHSTSSNGWSVPVTSTQCLPGVNHSGHSRQLAQVPSADQDVFVGIRHLVEFHCSQHVAPDPSMS